MQWIALCSTSLVLLVTSRIFRFVKNLKAIDYLPGFRCLFPSLELPGVMFPTSFWNPGLEWIWRWRSAGIYEQFKSDTISLVPFVGRACVYTRSIEVTSQILSNSKLAKLDMPVGLNEWGGNLLTTDHDVYKRHRRVVGPAFGSGISPMVWNETVKVYKEMLADEEWSDKTTATLESFNAYAHKFALILISRCGFGLPFSWTVSESSRNELELGKSMSGIASTTTIRVTAPRWLYKLPIKILQEMNSSYKTMETLLRSFISERAAVSTEDKESKQDLFNRLLVANEAEGNKKIALNEGELISNVFAFLFAGHADMQEIETSARAMSATLALLAVHPEEQEIAVKEIQRVLVNGRDPLYEDYDALLKVKACFLEGTRLFPPVYILMRETVDYVKFVTPTDNGDKTFVVAPRTLMAMDMIGICHNPRHFEDPTEFKPSRWYNRPESDLPVFSMGYRACIGRKFALAEALCFLTLILRDWVISPLLRDGETVKQWESRVIEMGEMTVTMGIGPVPLKLTKRV